MKTTLFAAAFVTLMSTFTAGTARASDGYFEKLAQDRAARREAFMKAKREQAAREQRWRALVAEKEAPEKKVARG